MSKETKQKNINGFTLIELMIATTLFTIVMMMGVGSLVVSSNFAKAAQKLRVTVDNVNFAMESMTRELRTGTFYYCLTGGDSGSLTGTPVKDCNANTGGPGNVIIFTPQQALTRAAYQIGPLRSNGTHGLQKCETSKGCSDIVSKDVDIKTLKFYVTGSDLPASGLLVQPSVEIIIKGIVTVKGVATPFALQSMAAQRSTE
jgi:prepilin-type N-terminal cleavage/methylation domain-containing protein